MHYFIGSVAVIVMWIVSWVVTKDANPFALARGPNGSVSTSQFQFLIFTVLTVFAYVVVASARMLSPVPTISLPDIPMNLLVLMGLSATTTASAKGITVSYISQGRIRSDDKSSVTQNRDGNPDLIKVQMLIWTLVTVGIYVTQVVRFIKSNEYQNPDNAALPDVDGALLVLMGVAQGGYVGGKLVSRNAGPTLDSVLPGAVKPGDKLKLLGIGFGKSQGPGDLVILTDQSGQEHDMGAIGAGWTETQIELATPSTLAAGAWSLQVRVNGVRSGPAKFEVA